MRTSCPTVSYSSNPAAALGSLRTPGNNLQLDFKIFFTQFKLRTKPNINKLTQMMKDAARTLLISEFRTV